MVSRVLSKKLVRDLMRRKGGLLTLVAIMTVGVGAYIGHASVYRDLSGSKARYYAEQRMADFWVNVKRAPEWAVARLADLPNVRTVQGRVNLAVRIDLPGVEMPISGQALSLPADRHAVLCDVLMRRGMWFSGRDDREVILNDEFAKANNLNPGDRIRVMLLDKQHDLLVVGTAMSPEFVYVIPPGGGLAPDPARTGVLYLNERFLQDSADLRGAYNQVIGLAVDATRPALERTLRLIEERLDAFGVTNTTPVQENPSARFLEDEITGLRVGSIIVPAIFLGVAALVLNVLLGRMVKQQRGIIGTLRALGVSRAGILRHYLGFGLIIGVAPGITGLAFGLWIQSAMIGLYRQFYALPEIRAGAYADIPAIAFLISIGFALVGALQGARYAIRLEPAEAMRPPPPESGRRVLLERIGFVWARLSFQWKMINRAIARNPFRSTVSVAAGFVSTSLVFAMILQMESLDYLMSYEFERVMRQDITVSLREPVGQGMGREILDIASVSAVEAQLGVVADLSNGPFRRRTGITCLVPGSRLYTPLDAAGRPVTVPDEGLVLSKKLAELLHVVPGDSLRLRPLTGLRQETVAVVTGTVDTFLGLGAYANVAYLSTLLGEAWSANTLLLNTYGGADREWLMAELRDRPNVIGIGERVRALQQIEATFGATMGTIISMMIFFSGLIAFGAVLNSTLVSLDERKREVATLRVLGFTPAQVARIFSGESLLLNGIGIVLGLGGGIGLLWLLSFAYNTELYRFPVVVDPAKMPVVVLIMAFFVLVAQAIVFRLVRRLPWQDVLNVRE